MPTRVQAFKEELEQLIFFTLKLILHWLALVVILGFVLLGFWLHHLFQRAYVSLEQRQAVEAQSLNESQSTKNRPQSGEKRGRTRKRQARRPGRKRPAANLFQTLSEQRLSEKANSH